MLFLPPTIAIHISTVFLTFLSVILLHEFFFSVYILVPTFLCISHCCDYSDCMSVFFIVAVMCVLMSLLQFLDFNHIRMVAPILFSKSASLWCSCQPTCSVFHFFFLSVVSITAIFTKITFKSNCIVSAYVYFLSVIYLTVLGIPFNFL